MNKVIKALFIQAGGTVEEENGNLWTYSDDLDPEKFAQLVIKECAEVCLQWNHDVPYTDEQCAAAIIEHFGVTE